MINILFKPFSIDNSDLESAYFLEDLLLQLFMMFA